MVPITPLPPVPAWAAPLMGLNTGQGFKKVTDCRGAFDAIYNPHAAPAEGAQANGWGWLTLAKAPVTQVVIANSAGTIVGGGGVDYDRPDVPEAIPDVNTKRVGWHAVIKGGSASLTALALLPDHALCELGIKAGGSS